MTNDNKINPRNNNCLFGHEKAEDLFLRSWKSGNLHHAWIISGPKGIGKATLAFRIARFLQYADIQNKASYTNLNVPENSSVFKQIAGGSNPDVIVLERDFIETDKRKIIKAIQKGEALDSEELGELKKSAFIRVDDVRKVGEFLSKTSDSWRVVIVDSVDDMNKNSANALLKILEEPPLKTVLLLISHNPGMLLPTILSRCAKLQLSILSDTTVASLLRRFRPQLNEQMIEKIVSMSSGSIGKAMNYSDLSAYKIYEQLCEILYARKNMSVSSLLEFSSNVTANPDLFMLLEEFIGKFIKENMVNAENPEELYKCWQDANKMFADCVSVNMDKKLMLVNLISKICKVL
jgi:DNA polymerase-3 subunit delta'